MALQPGELYHIYNRGNNREPIFFNPKTNVISWLKCGNTCSAFPHFGVCLMRNHFHWLVAVREEADLKRCSTDLRILLSSYTRAIQRQQGRTGSLFQQHTQARHLATPAYALLCFSYILQNPLRAQLVREPEQWVWSSFLDLMGQRAGTLCDQAKTRELLDLPDNPTELRQLILQSMPENLDKLLY